MGDFGVTPWGRDWVRLAEPTSLTRPNPALPKARSLARNESVHVLSWAAGAVTATVLDGREHAVRLTIPLWTDADRHTAAAALPDTRHPGADLPDEAHATLRDTGIPLAPVDVESTCDCTGRSHPCRHVLAVYFEIARRLDERPTHALTLRGGTPPAPATQPARIPLTDIDPRTFYGDQAEQSQK